METIGCIIVHEKRVRPLLKHLKHLTTEGFTGVAKGFFRKTSQYDDLQSQIFERAKELKAKYAVCDHSQYNLDQGIYPTDPIFMRVDFYHDRNINDFHELPK